jgi:hypothetical protein
VPEFIFISIRHSSFLPKLIRAVSDKGVVVCAVAHVFFPVVLLEAALRIVLDVTTLITISLGSYFFFSVGHAIFYVTCPGQPFTSISTTDDIDG